ncbi:hypothetical protein WMY93_017460 [Mugilogobius chulae]|uniref:Uncharacterized protein n=1 Tax=Mugilogobius chulae TaxID=88201 RepID=A0AAW0NPE2_9GOBI
MAAVPHYGVILCAGFSLPGIQSPRFSLVTLGTDSTHEESTMSPQTNKQTNKERKKERKVSSIKQTIESREASSSSMVCLQLVAGTFSRVRSMNYLHSSHHSCICMAFAKLEGSFARHSTYCLLWTSEQESKTQLLLLLPKGL